MRPEPPPRFHKSAIERTRSFARLHPAAKILVRNMVRRPARLLLSVFAISLAVAIIVVGRYFMDAIDWTMDVQFRTVSREKVAVGFLHPEPARAFHEVEHLPGVLYAEPFRSVPVELTFEHRSERTALVGLRPDSRLRRVIDQRLRRVPLPPDGIVLTTHLAETLGVLPGELVTVKVLEGERALRQLPVAARVDELLGQSAYMDIEALHRFLREGGSISGAYLSVDPLESGRLYRVLKRTPAVAAVAIREATIASFEETIGRTFGTFTSILVLLASVIALGMVYNGARIALSERGRELASLRVLGFTRGEVAVMLLGEQALITVLAIPLGCGIGYGLAALIARAYDSELFRLPLVLTPATYGFALLVVTVATALSAFIVNRRIHRLDLIEVLKTRE
jgi:putative ABC transport system permease protein